MRHPLHSICPYFAMFPEEFVAKQVLAYSKRGDFVFDPFCGRGTTIFESLLNGRCAVGTDINPVAACIAGAKADPPTLKRVANRLNDLRELFHGTLVRLPKSPFFEACFHKTTLRQIIFLRSQLEWANSKVDRFIAAVLLGCLHGESHKSQNCLSNRMPRTISTKPDYSVRWWRKHHLEPPERDTFAILERVSAFRLSQPLPRVRGSVRLRDARRAAAAFPKLSECIDLVVTSPPYLDTTDYSEDQWLRLWFLGGPERPTRPPHSDDRHTNREMYWDFLAESWNGCQPLLKSRTVIVVRIGGISLSKADLLEGLKSSLRIGLPSYKLRVLDNGNTTTIKNSQTNVFRPGSLGKRYEHDFAFRIH